MPLNDLEDQLLAHLAKLIQDGMPFIYENMSQRGITTGTPPAPPELKIMIGDNTVSGYYPVIRISSATPMQSEWLATGVRKDRYSFNIDSDVKIAKKEIEDKAVMAINNALRNWLLHKPNLAMEILNTGATYFNAWCEATTLGRKGDGTIRTARFTWWCDVANSYEYAWSSV